MSSYLRFLKTAKLRNQAIRGGERSPILPSTSLIDVVKARDVHPEYQTILTDDFIKSFAQGIWPTYTSEQYSMVRYFLAYYIGNLHNESEVHILKEFFFDVFKNPATITNEERFNYVIKGAMKDPLFDIIIVNEEVNAVDASFIDIRTGAALKTALQNVMSIPILQKLMKILYSQGHVKIKKIVELFSGAFLLSFVKTGNVTSDNIKKRVGNLIGDIEITVPGVTPDSCRQVFDMIKDRIDTNVLDPQDVIDYFAALLEDSTNMAIKPLIDHAAYRNLTALFIICKSFSDFPDFPWAPIMDKNPGLVIEAQRYFNTIKEIGENKLIGYQISGASKAFPNLAGICLQLQIVAGNQHTLSKYKGVGSIESIGKPLFEKYQKWANDYALASDGTTIDIAKLMSGDTRTSEFYNLTLVSNSIKGFLSEKLDELGDEVQDDEGFKSFFGGGSRRDDDDDDNSDGAPAPKRPRNTLYPDLGDNMDSEQIRRKPRYPGVDAHQSDVIPSAAHTDLTTHATAPPAYTDRPIKTAYPPPPQISEMVEMDTEEPSTSKRNEENQVMVSTLTKVAVSSFFKQEDVSEIKEYYSARDTITITSLSQLQTVKIELDKSKRSIFAYRSEHIPSLNGALIVIGYVHDSNQVSLLPRPVILKSKKTHQEMMEEWTRETDFVGAIPEVLVCLKAVIIVAAQTRRRSTKQV